MKTTMIALIYVIMATILFASETTITSAFAPYINIKAGTWVQSNVDQDPFVMKLYGNSNFGLSWKMNDMDAQVELGKPANLRILKASLPLWEGRLTVGQTYIAGLDRCSSQATDESFEADGPGKPGIMFMARENQLSWAKDRLYATVLGPIKVDPNGAGKLTKGTPKVVVAYDAKLGEINVMPVIGYSHYWLGEDSFDAGIIGLNFKTSVIQGQIFCSQNPNDLGILTLAGSGARQGDVTVNGAWVQFSKDNFSFGTGYSQNSQDVEAGSIFLNYKATLNKYTTLFPEIGYLYGKGIVSNNTVYAGVKILFAVK